MKIADIPRMSKPEILILNRPILSIKYPIGIRQIALVNHKNADNMPITNAEGTISSNIKMDIKLVIIPIAMKAENVDIRITHTDFRLDKAKWFT
jgi:hypothetical protein